MEPGMEGDAFMVCLLILLLPLLLLTIHPSQNCHSALGKSQDFSALWDQLN